MSFFAGGGGGRTRQGTPVRLHVYDLSPMNSSILMPLGLPILHTGVEVFGTEYTFAGGAGVFGSDTVKQAEGAVYSHR